MEKNHVIDTYMELARRLGYKNTQVEEAVNELHAILDEKNNKIHFEHNGVHYFMTPKEIEAAYRYQEKKYRLQDAKYHLNDLVFGVDPDAIPEDAAKEAIAEFEGWYNVRYADVSDEANLEALADCFLNSGDCNRAENDVWDDLLRDFFRELRCSGKGIHGSFMVPDLTGIYHRLYAMNEEAAEEDYLEYFRTNFHPDLLLCCTTVQSAREYISNLVSEILEDTGSKETTREWLVDAGADDELIAHCGLN